MSKFIGRTSTVGGVVGSDLDGYVTSEQDYDGYIAFFTGENAIAGDNDLFYNRATGELSLGGDMSIGGDIHIDGDFTNYNSALNDMGYIVTSDKRGYEVDSITDKTLHNIVLRGSARTDNGGLRIDSTQDPDTFEIYLRDQWNTVMYDFTFENSELEHTPLDNRIDVWSGNSNSLGLNGIPVVQEYKTSMGAYPAKRLIDGGTF